MAKLEPRRVDRPLLFRPGRELPIITDMEARTRILARRILQTLSFAVAVLGIMAGPSLARAHWVSARPLSGIAHPKASGADGKILFNGNGLLGWHDQSANADRVAITQDPDGAADRVLRFTALNSDVAPLTPSDNPRAQLVTPSGIVTKGNPFWESYEVYIPSGFPLQQTYNSWISLGSPFYGPPYNGPPSTNLEIENGDFEWRTNAYATDPGVILWRSPVVLGEWIRFTWHITPAVSGFAELYVNGGPLTVTYDGHVTRGVSLPVVDPTNDEGPWYSQLSVYMKRNAFSRLTMYFKDFEIATTEAAAEGTLSQPADSVSAMTLRPRTWRFRRWPSGTSLRVARRRHQPAGVVAPLLRVRGVGPRS